ncbi:hypothetical protein [Undibacterium sp. Di24W]|uniref:hypothetical protein n=1 Tax=Undibacterium sp. Di24W TaxID=3413033 RepID=UPI003BF1723F
MKIPSVLPLTAAQSRASRFQLGLTQAEVIDQSGVPGYKLKQFETGRFVPDMPFLQSLRDFYQEKGIDLTDASPASAPIQEPVKNSSAIVQAVPRAALLPARMGFVLSDSLSDTEIGELLDRMDSNDARIFDLLKTSTSTGFFGGHSEETVSENRELFGAMAENYLLFRYLQGRNLFDGFDPESEIETHLHLVHDQFVKSPLSKKVIPTIKSQVEDLPAIEQE